MGLRKHGARDKVAAMTKACPSVPGMALPHTNLSGVIMRLRRKAYEASAAFRAAHNGYVIEEPKTLDAIPV